MKDVASRAGVSLASVSYVVNGTKRLSEPTERRVRAAMDELGFQPNALARGLASRRTGFLALLLSAVEKDLGPTEVAYIASAATSARAANYNLLLWPGPHELASGVDEMVSRGLVDGALVMEVRLDDPRVDVLRARDTPHVLIGRTGQDAGDDYVDIDFEQTADAAVDHLVDLGHRAIGLVGHAPSAYQVRYGPSVRLLAAFEAAAQRRDVRLVHSPCEDSSSAGRAVLASWLDHDPAITAVATMNYRATFGVIGEASARGLSVPHDLSVLGVLSSPEAADMTYPALSTLSAPGTELGRQAVQALVDLLTTDQHAGVQALLPCALELRGSTAAPR